VADALGVQGGEALQEVDGVDPDFPGEGGREGGREGRRVRLVGICSGKMLHVYALDTQRFLRYIPREREDGKEKRKENIEKSHTRVHTSHLIFCSKSP
jgi:hypothetical protein